MKTDRKNAVLDAYRKALGNVTMACKACNIDRRTFYQWCEDDPEFKKSVQDIRENELGDFIENALMQRIQLGDTTAIIFACKTLCKNRGYVERQEQQIIGNPFEELMKRLPDPEDTNK